MLCLDNFKWNQLNNTEILKPEHRLAEPELLFEKIEDEAITLQLEKLAQAKKENEAAAYKAQEIKPLIDFSDFEKLDIRVGHILSCEKVKKADKLLKFTLDDGSGTLRTIVSGIAKFYQPEELVGQQVLFIANLAPRRLMGIESQGMILSAQDFDNTLSVTTLLRKVKPGSQVS
jgi:methionine--tRNA ligase, beta subunit